MAKRSLLYRSVLVTNFLKLDQTFPLCMVLNEGRNHKFQCLYGNLVR